MIESLLVATPREILKREPSPDLDKFEKVTGIWKTRRYDGSSLQFVIDAIDEANFKAKDVDAVIVVTQSPDRLSPCMAVDIHKHLGLRPNIPAFDVNHACDGWLMGLWLAAQMGRRTLVVCVDRLRYNKTPIEGLIFSDAVSLTIVDMERALLPRTAFLTDGSGSAKLYCGLNGEMDMDGSATFDFVTSKVPAMIKEFESTLHSDILIQHQANMSMNRIVEIRSGFAKRALYSIEEFGNQSMNSIPTCIAYNEHRTTGERLLCAGFGAGFTAILMQLTWPKTAVSKMVEL